MRLFIFYILLVLTGFCAGDDYQRQSALQTDIYRPSSVPAGQLLSILRPLYPSGTLFSADNQQLIIRAEQATMDEIQSLLLQLDHPARTFVVQLSNRLTNSDTAIHYSTKSRSSYMQRFLLSENSTLTVVKEKQRQQVTSLSPVWVRVDTVPVDQEYLNLTLLSADDRIYLTIKRQSLKNGELQLVNQQVNGPIGQWLALTHDQQQTSVKSWSTQRESDLTLYVKVDRSD